MQANINFWTVFYAVATFQGFFIGFTFLFQKKGDRKPNLLLSIILFLLSFYLLDIFLGQMGFFLENPHFSLLTVPIWYLLPPLTYYYVKILLKEKINLSVLSLLHIIPFALFIFKLAPFYILPATIKLKYITGEIVPPGGSIYNYAMTMVKPIQGSLYFLYIFHLVSCYKRTKPANKKALSDAYLNWLILFILLMNLFFIGLLLILSAYFLTSIAPQLLTKVPFAVFSIILYSIGYLAVVRPEEFQPINIIKKRKNGITFDQEFIDSTLMKIDKIMQSEKLFLQSDLKYSDIASKLNISVRQFSEFLNKALGKTFNDFINEYRVNEVKENLKNGDRNLQTILAIALDSGFNSKASFNRIFKKHTGLTPTEYLKLINIEELAN